MNIRGQVIVTILALGMMLPRLGNAQEFTWGRALAMPEDWYASAQATVIADNLLAQRLTSGGWNKNVDTSRPKTERTTSDLRSDLRPFSIDNNATTRELRLLARIASATGETRYRLVTARAIEAVLAAQYPTGGWPQVIPPPRTSYHRHITFNDDAMVRVLTLLREVSESESFVFLEPTLRERSGQALEIGIRCILDCQIAVDGQPTVWCAQHDEITLEPRSGRAYEHVSLSGKESFGIVQFLMTIPSPNDRIRKAVENAATWFEKSKITGIRVSVVNRDRQVVQDENSGPIWARFYEISSNQPIFSGRDGVIRYNYNEIEAERRNGYSWYDAAPARLPELLIEWRKRWSE